MLPSQCRSNLFALNTSLSTSSESPTAKPGVKEPISILHSDKEGGNVPEVTWYLARDTTGKRGSRGETDHGQSPRCLLLLARLRAHIAFQT